MGTQRRLVGPEELQEILRLHGLWLRKEKGGVRADLSGSYLGEVNLCGSNLTDACLSRVDFTGIKIVSFAEAPYGIGSNLSRVNLTRADLTGAVLELANLTDAILVDADLRNISLDDSKLIRANLTSARLAGAHLTFADLTDANLTDADLTGANLLGAKLPPRFQPQNILQYRFSKAYQRLMDRLERGTEARKRMTQKRLRFFCDLVDAGLNLSQLAREHDVSNRTVIWYRDAIEQDLDEPLTREVQNMGDFTNRLELTEVGQSLLAWIRGHPQFLADGWTKAQEE